MDNFVLDNPKPIADEERIREMRAELETLPLKARIKRIIQCFDELPENEHQRLSELQGEYDGRTLVELLEMLMQRFELSTLQIALSAGMDASAFGKMLRGERRQFQQEHIDTLLEDLWQQRKLTDPTLLLVLHRALRIAAVMHADMLKDIEPRLQGIRDVGERIQAVSVYFEKMYPAWAEVYDATQGAVPALLPPLTVSVAEQYLRETNLMAYDLRPARKTARYIEPELVHVPAGAFYMGSSDWDKDARESEKPRHRLYLPDYWIGRYPVTNEEYRYFLLANPKQQKPVSWYGTDFPKGKSRHPVVSVSWDDAVAYCRWLSNICGKIYALPSEAEWEKAARGSDGRIYPWGNTFDKTRCNTSESKNGDTTPVGKYSPRGDSPYGCADMSGNVWEWTRSVLKDYPYDPNDGREASDASGSRVNRGGSWSNNSYYVRLSRRLLTLPSYDWLFDGFRVVALPSGRF